VDAAGGTGSERTAAPSSDGDTAAVGRRVATREEIRASLVAAANELFDEVGYDGARTAEIARRAGVAQATLFRHFETKADLALHHLREVVDQLVAGVLRRPLAESPYAAILAVVGEPGVIAALTSPQVRVEGERLAVQRELAARVYWMLTDIRHLLADDFAARLGVPRESARARVVASVAVDAAVFTTEVVADRPDADPTAVYLGALAELRPLLEATSVSAGC